MIYYTVDNDGDYIPAFAKIFSAPTKEIAEKDMQKYYEGSDYKVTGVEVGRFGDCWIKTHCMRSIEINRDDWETEAGELMILAPGEHPGGNSYWVTPCAEIYIPKVTEIAEDA